MSNTLFAIEGVEFCDELDSLLQRLQVRIVQILLQYRGAGQNKLC